MAGDDHGLVKGVRINCIEDQQNDKVKAFTVVEVLKDEAILDNSTPKSSAAIAPISTRVGMAVRLHKHTATERNDESGFYDNKPASLLMSEINPNKENFGLIDCKWRYSMGSVLVLRVDGEDLEPEHVEALCTFCQAMLIDEMATAVERGDSNDDQAQKAERLRILDLLTPINFRKFFLEYRIEKMKEEIDWVDIVSPV